MNLPEMARIAPLMPPLSESRTHWRQLLVRIARPVLVAGAAGQLRQVMPVEQTAHARQDRREVAHWEAVGRTLAGIAPLLEMERDAPTDDVLSLAQTTLTRACDRQDPGNPPLYVREGLQILVDTAFLALGILRAPHALYTDLAPKARDDIAHALISARRIKAHHNNWLAFPFVIEAALARMGLGHDDLRADLIYRQFEQWYRGDGMFSDGPRLAVDYYNSIVMHPMLLAGLEVFATHRATPVWEKRLAVQLARSQRLAEHLERMIGPDGTFPPLGRSLSYRGGLFHLLSHLALVGQLPPSLSPAQVRGALSAMIGRSHTAPGTFSRDGWLRPGLNGHQPGLAEDYVTTGSLYLTTTAFLPLGLPAESDFWSAPSQPWTQHRIWVDGLDVEADRAFKG